MAKATPAIISIHDVAPTTLARVKALIELIPSNCREDVLLLVIPGGEWNPEQLQQLRDWQQQGFILAGHGWHHRARNIRGWYHRLHSLLISRDAAEHLSLTQAEINALIEKNYQWFIDNNFTAPQVYVPPAWAMGAISKSRLQQLPFRYYETTGGVFDAKTERFKHLPLVGFEADNLFRKWLLSIWNKINLICGSSKRPVRISIHPQDNQLLLAASLRNCLRKTIEPHSYASLLNSNVA